jgi:enoyl-CoA hydratase/carnithine racemase
MALLALCGTSIDAATALRWGLVDAVTDDFDQVGAAVGQITPSTRP